MLGIVGFYVFYQVLVDQTWVLTEQSVGGPMTMWISSSAEQRFAFDAAGGKTGTTTGKGVRKRRWGRRGCEGRCEGRCWRGGPAPRVRWSSPRSPRLPAHSVADHSLSSLSTSSSLSASRLLPAAYRLPTSRGPSPDSHLLSRLPCHLLPAPRFPPLTPLSQFPISRVGLISSPTSGRLMVAPRGLSVTMSVLSNGATV